jgi:hypothetical protein
MSILPTMSRRSIAIVTGVRAMRGMACGAEMILMNVVQDDTMAVPGFEYQTFMCSECQDVERRLVFTKQDRDADTDSMPEQAAPPVVPASAAQDEHVAASGLFTRPLEPAQTVPVEPTQTAPEELTRTARARGTDHPEPPAAPHECLDESTREAPHLQRAGNRDRTFRSVPPSSASSEAESHGNLDERVRSPTETIVSRAPTACDESEAT